MKRALVSFQGPCPLKCKHCYTPELNRASLSDTKDVVNSIKGTDAEIIYVSHDYENFYNQGKGIELCEKLFDKYHTHLMIITRMNLDDDIIKRLSALSVRMENEEKRLIFAESIFATDSYRISESEICAPPRARIETLKKVKAKGIPTILMLRPVFPEKYVCLDEYKELLDSVKGYVNAVVTSGLIVTERILETLRISDEMDYGVNLGSEYLSSLENTNYVNVENELKFIVNECRKRNLRCYLHSMNVVEEIVEGFH